MSSTSNPRTVAQRERAQLADLFDQVGPDQPTLDEGWLTADLLHHLLARERRPDALPGIFGGGVFATWTEKVMAGYRRLPWRDRVEKFRAGPPRFSPLRQSGIDSAFNTGEFFIHHEDVRRGVPGWRPRDLEPATTDALTDLLRSGITRSQLEKFGVGFQARLPDRRQFELVLGDPAVTLVGEPGELVLWISGRRTACEVEVEGSSTAVQMIDRAG